MQTGRFINKLVDGREQFFQTEGAEKLLNNKNLTSVWNLGAQDPGEYNNKFPDDMAITNTIISIAVDNDGRTIHENDTIIVKFDDLDRQQILDTMNEHMGLLRTMVKLQHDNGVELKNPLAEVKMQNG